MPNKYAFGEEGLDQSGDKNDKEAQSVDEPSEQNVHSQLPMRVVMDFMQNAVMEFIQKYLRCTLSSICGATGSSILLGRSSLEAARTLLPTRLVSCPTMARGGLDPNVRETNAIKRFRTNTPNLTRNCARRLRAHSTLLPTRLCRVQQ